MKPDLLKIRCCFSRDWLDLLKPWFILTLQIYKIFLIKQ